MGLSDTIFTAACVKFSMLFYQFHANIGEFAVPENSRTVTYSTVSGLVEQLLVTH
jgi:hypothetical protein